MGNECSLNGTQYAVWECRLLSTTNGAEYKRLDEAAVVLQEAVCLSTPQSTLCPGRLRLLLRMTVAANCVLMLYDPLKDAFLLVLPTDQPLSHWLPGLRREFQGQ